jgi:SAM-dependent methyltransferase
MSARSTHSDVPEHWRWLPKPELLEVLNLRPGLSVAAVGRGAADLVREASATLGPEGQVFPLESLDADTIPPASCDRVLLANQWARLPDPLAALRRAATLLRDDGRLILVEWHAHAQCPGAPDTRVALHEMVWLLEHNSWDIHRHGDLGPHCYFLEAGVSDESVQS